MIQEKHYDIIFLDHMMPELDGVETLHRMKAMTNHPCEKTPVIALTANAIQGAKEMYLKEGFDEFLSKPIPPEKLERMIKAWLPKDLILTKEQVAQLDKEENHSQLPKIEGLDLEIAFKHLPNEELLLETINDFYSTMIGEADFLHNCYEKLDLEEGMLDSYRIKVHAMKSSSALIGIMELSELAKELEMAVKDQDKEFLHQNTETFLDKWCSYKEKLSVYIKDTEKEEIKDVSEILNKLEQLKEVMEFMDIDSADEIMKEIKNYEYSESINAKIESLGAAVVNLDVETVSSLVDEISKLV